MSTTRRRTSTDRLAMIHRYQRLRAAGYSVDDAVNATGVPRASLLRWVRNAEAAEAAEAGETETKARRGRPAAHVYTEPECNALRLLRLRHESLEVAVRRFLRHEACRPETAEHLEDILDRAAATGREPSWPLSLKRAAHISEELRAAFRSDTELRKFAPSITRGAFWTDDQGNAVELLPHDVWESDDMSLNEPFRYREPVTGTWRIGRQMIFTQDRYTGAVLGHTLVGRDRDAYRAEDILDHLLDLVDVFGLPRRWRIERGVWQSLALDGVALDDARARKLGYEGERWNGRRIGGLGELFGVEHQFASNGKGGIESFFNAFQKETAHESTHVGRKRGEFEGAARKLRRAQKETATDAQVEVFWEAGEASDTCQAACLEYNSLPHKRAMHGDRRLVPNDLLREHAPPMRPLPDSERWRFLPVKRLAVVRKGVFRVTIDKVRYEFPGQGEGIALDHGHRAVVCFHPQRPELGCTVVEAEFGPRRRHGAEIGEPLFSTGRMDHQPQWTESGERAQGPGREKIASVRREFRAIRAAEAGAASLRPAPPAKKSHLGDGRGQAVTVESGFASTRGLEPAKAEAAPDRGRSIEPRESIASRRSVTPAPPPPDLDELARLEAESLDYL